MEKCAAAASSIKTNSIKTKLAVHGRTVSSYPTTCYSIIDDKRVLTGAMVVVKYVPGPISGLRTVQFSAAMDHEDAHSILAASERASMLAKSLHDQAYARAQEDGLTSWSRSGWMANKMGKWGWEYFD